MECKFNISLEGENNIEATLCGYFYLIMRLIQYLVAPTTSKFLTVRVLVNVCDQREAQDSKDSWDFIACPIMEYKWLDNWGREKKIISGQIVGTYRLTDIWYASMYLSRAGSALPLGVIWQTLFWTHSNSFEFSQGKRLWAHTYMYWEKKFSSTQTLKYDKIKIKKQKNTVKRITSG